MKKGDFVLIDLWAKEKKPGAIMADITWTGFIGKKPPDEIVKVFTVVRDARDAAVKFVQSSLSAGKAIRGCDVDDACRKVIADAGLRAILHPPDRAFDPHGDARQRHEHRQPGNPRRSGRFRREPVFPSNLACILKVVSACGAKSTSSSRMRRRRSSPASPLNANWCSSTHDQRPTGDPLSRPRQNLSRQTACRGGPRTRSGSPGRRMLRPARSERRRQDDHHRNP